MNRDFENFHEIINKLDFQNPASPEMNKVAAKSGRDNLKYILKKTGYYSVFFGIILTVFNFARKFGINITFLKSKIIIAFISVNIGASAIVGIYHYNKSPVPVLSENAKIKQEQQNENSVAGNLDKGQLKEDIQGSKRKKKKIVTYIIPEIGVMGFVGAAEFSPDVITAKIVFELKKKLGSKVALLHKDIKENDRKKISRVITGSVRNVGNTRLITARIVNIKDSKVEYAASVEIKSEMDYTDACNRISIKIADKLKRNH